ncbi:DMT family transporter [Ferrovibrio sp. MS7]|jgi:O-acetylserine/cysteine efflux transporter|uniref:DMT family transporter n=1 Tax=Ferrovibrio plantarum TaxID=3119164 RepID=UPI001B77D950|nr:DMT family transporter [Ferrovibrio sp.]
MRPLHLLLLISICAVWGFNFVASKLAVGHFPPIFFTGLRFLGLGLLLLPWLKLHKGQMSLVLQIALFMGTLHFALMFNAIKMAHDVSVIAVIVQLGGPVSALLAWLMLGETVRWRRGLGIALAFIGSVVMSFDPAILTYGMALLICLLAMVSMSYGQVLVRRIQHVDPLAMQAWIGVASAPGLLLLSYFFEQGQWQATQAAGWGEWSLLAYSIIGVSLFGHGGVYYLLRLYPVALVNPGVTMAPVMGILFSVIILGERLSERALIGAAITLLGVLIVTLRDSQIADKKPAQSVEERAALAAAKVKAGSD